MARFRPVLGCETRRPEAEAQSHWRAQGRTGRGTLAFSAGRDPPTAMGRGGGSSLSHDLVHGPFPLRHSPYSLTSESDGPERAPTTGISQYGAFLPGTVLSE